MAIQLFEEAKYAFVYGQYLSAITLSIAYVERTLAATHYACGKSEMGRASGEALFKEALDEKIISQDEYDLFDRARKLRNPILHYRHPGHENNPEIRAARSDEDFYALLEEDAKTGLLAAMRMNQKNFIPRGDNDWD